MADGVMSLRCEQWVLHASVPELIAGAERAAAGNRGAEAARLYRDWIAYHQDDPLIYAAYFNFGVLLNGIGDDRGACDALSAAIRQNQDFAPAYINLGMALERLDDRLGSVQQWQALVNRLSAVTPEAIAHKTTALNQMSRVFSAAHLDSNAEEALRQSLELNTHQRDVLQHWLSMRQRQCKWPVVQPIFGRSRAEIVTGFSPLSLAAHTDDPMLQLAVAAEYSRRDVKRPSRSFASLVRAGSTCKPIIHLGYLSSDLREHAIGHLMAELFELHDRSRVSVTVYYCGHPVQDALHHRIMRTADQWRDIANLPDEAVAQQIVDDEIDVLIDINGFTHGARTTVLAMRPAPVIVNWLGFPSTTGSPYHDYIIGDDIIIPAGSEIYYSENVKRLPCYQPNDRRRAAASDPPTRADAGLPEDATVFCCFNAAHKITAFTWQRWMRILKGVPGSVLWLLDGVPSTNARLREHAVAHDVSPDRILFAQKLSNPFHLARYKLADLFLDTSPYGAHTTASDALWMGVPILTLPGRSFASRVCASLVSAAGLPDLVCDSAEAYVSRAIALATDRPQLDALKRRLREGRDSCLLFDTPQLVARLEDLYREMVSETRTGRRPRPDLLNLEHYKEIGAALDREDLEMGSVADYHDRYISAMARLDEFEMIAPDQRLWEGSRSATASG